MKPAAAPQRASAPAIALYMRHRRAGLDHQFALCEVIDRFGLAEACRAGDVVRPRRMVRHTVVGPECIGEVVGPTIDGKWEAQVDLRHRWLLLPGQFETYEAARAAIVERGQL